MFWLGGHRAYATIVFISKDPKKEFPIGLTTIQLVLILEL